MDKGAKRTFQQMEASSESVDVYEFSPSEHLLLEKWSRQRGGFKAQPHHCLDIDSKIGALNVSPSIVGLVSFSGDHVLSQASGTILETDHTYNYVMTSLHLVRSSTTEEADFADNI
ncbi:hypothetical protein RND81_04G244800 [Saponaria officinalis]|uniref:Uncharacterized protein n=1 Tax=Saponaria officinalis TaxID=3572 RepID=A0AAW1LQ40_SAPOF